MSFIDDKMYKKHVVPRMAIIVSRVNVMEIMPHLPCLTDHDRENIVAKRDMRGNYDSMALLLDCLKRRENWPEQFITALEACDHLNLAAELRAEYNALRGTNNSSPSSPQTTVTRAHVHQQPAASHSSVQETGENTPAAVSAPAGASTPPPEPAAQASPPPKTPPSSEVQAPEAASPPEPVAEPPQADPAPAPALSTPPPSPPSAASPRTQTPPPPPPQSEPAPHQEPEENSEPGDLSQEVSAEVSPVHVATPQPSPPVKQRETVTTTAAEVTPPQSPPPTQIDSVVTDGSSLPMKTPEKAPVQDSSPPVDTEPATIPVEAAVTGAAGVNAATIDDSSVCLSKPSELVSIHPQVENSPAIPEPVSPEQPYSGDSHRLEISGSIPETTTHVPACSESAGPALSPPVLQENGITINHSEPEENQYDSPCLSLDTEDVRSNVVQISQELSILNLSAPPAAAPKGNGEAAKEVVPAPPPSTTTTSIPTAADTAPSENHRPSEPELKTPQDPEEEISPRTMLPANTKYIVTAAGVGACALLLAWKFKN